MALTAVNLAEFFLYFPNDLFFFRRQFDRVRNNRKKIVKKIKEKELVVSDKTEVEGCHCDGIYHLPVPASWYLFKCKTITFFSFDE